MSWGSCRLLLESAQPPSHFLVRAGSRSRCGVVTGTVLGFSLMQLCDRKGEGDEKKRGENRERGEWGKRS